MNQHQEEGYQVGWNTFSNEGVNILVNPKFNIELRLVFTGHDGTLIRAFGFNVGQSLQNPPCHPLHKDDPQLGQCLVLERDRNLAYAQCKYIVPGGAMLVTFAQRYFDNVVASCVIEGNPEGQFYLVGEVYPESEVKYFSLGERGVRFDSKNFQGFLRIPDKNSTTSFFDNWSQTSKFLLSGEDKDSLANGRFVVCPITISESYLSILTSPRDVKISRNISKFVGSELHIIRSNQTLFEKYSTSVSVDGDSNYQIGLLAPIYWNLSYDPKKKIPYIPVSKSWVGMMTEIMETGDSQIDKPGENIRSTRDDGPMIFNWDSALAAMSLSHFDTHLAQKLITGLLSYQKKNGSIPHLIVKDKKTNLVNPPIIFLACMKVFLYSQNYNFLKEVYPQLVRYFDYLMDYRKGNEEYRMAWGAPAEDRTYPGLTGKTGAAYESGMENSPAWDGAQYDTETGTMNLNSVGFTAVMGLASSIMSKISEVLNNNRNKKKFEEHNNQFRRSLLKYFFDPKTQTFRNRYFDGTFSKVQTPDSFFPLFTGKMGHSFTDESYALLHEDKAFANEYMIPSLRRDHPDFDPDGDSWCGRILPPLNYLVHLALITQGNTKESFDLAVNSFNMFHKEYVEHGHVHENYSALTGRGNPAEKTYARSCPFYTWGNLMPLMLLEEIFDVGWNYRLNFGSHFLKNKVEFKNIKVGNTYYSVSCKPQETLLRKNQSELISASPAARFTEFQADWETVKFRLFGNGLTTVKLFQVGDRVEIYVRINNKPAHYINMPRKGPITFDVKADPHVPLNITVFFKR